MQRRHRRDPCALWAALPAALALLLAGCGAEASDSFDLPGALARSESEAPAADSGAFPVPPPPFSSEDVFPCSGCHDESLPPNPERRTLTMAHEEVVLRHDEAHRWCLDCHDAKDRDRLHLASGELVEFTESYRLCGQCHGDKYRDWRAGVHGRRTGHWNGEKQYLLCVHCHNSHDPAFKPLAPKPAPNRPEATR
jgi:hypothetical protein